MRIFLSDRVLLPAGRLRPATVLEVAGLIAEVTAVSPADARRRWPDAEVVEVPGILAPGFIDLHVHGFAGHDLGTADTDGVLAMARDLERTGATAFLPTLASTGPAETLRQVERIRLAAESQRAGARLLGIRLEGPYLSHGKRGAQPPEALRPPSPAEFDELQAAAGGRVRMIDIAPELPGALALMERAAAAGVIPCTGHTEASTAQALAAVDQGARHCTHLFNAMSALHHREPGPVGVYIADPRTTIELIADGIHLHPLVLALAVQAKRAERTALVTDAILAAGLPDGSYEFLNRTVTVAEGAVRLPDGTLAGSTLTLDRAVRNIHRLAGIPVEPALRMASATPAAILGDATRGQIQAGRRADLVHLDGDLRVVETWVARAPREAMAC